MERNYHCRWGEIDIIAQEEDTLCFVEVKTRMEGYLYEGKTAVNLPKQQKLVKTALTYLSEHTITLQPRFDVAEVYITKEKKVYINYMKNAFDAQGLENADLW